MAKGYVDLDYVNKLISKSDRLKKRADQEALKIFNESKAKMVNEFENHPVTREIEGGNTSTNLSKTLNNQSNLFSFIGFNEGETPIPVLKQTVIENTNVDLNPEIKENSDSITYSYSVTLPQEKEILEATRMPWEKGSSWAMGIEKGISGFSHFLNGLFRTSRSGGGIQSKYDVKSVHFKPKSYLSGIFNSFKLNIK